MIKITEINNFKDVKIYFGSWVEVSVHVPLVLLPLDLW
jgi:hypothetical protein